MFKCWNLINIFCCVIEIGGTIGSEPEPIESRQFNDKDNVNAAGVFGSGGKRRQNGTYPSTPQPPGSTVPPNPPTTDENLIYGKKLLIFFPNVLNVYLIFISLKSSKSREWPFQN